MSQRRRKEAAKQSVLGELKLLAGDRHPRGSRERFEKEAVAEAVTKAQLIRSAQVVQFNVLFNATFYIIIINTTIYSRRIVCTGAPNRANTLAGVPFASRMSTGRSGLLFFKAG